MAPSTTSPTSQTNYYPFGLSLYNGASQGNMILNQNRYLYNGKELQDDFGLNWGACPAQCGNYGARFNDPQIARWHSVDPLAEKYYGMNPYNYVGNNPVMRIDPDGRSFIGAYGTVNHTGAADNYVYDEAGYADRAHGIMGNPGMLINIGNRYYFNGGGNRANENFGGGSRRSSGVNDDLPEFQNYSSNSSTENSDFDIQDNSQFDNLRNVPGVVNTSSKGIFVRPENIVDERRQWVEVLPGFSFVGPYDGFAANGVIIKVNNLQNQMNIIVSDKSINAPIFQMTINIWVNFWTGHFANRNQSTYFNIDNPPSGWTNPFVQ